MSLDQIYAKEYGQDTAIPSMQLCIEPVDQAGGCAYGYACVYMDTLSWASPTEPLPTIRNPRAVFNQLFGLGSTPEDRTARRKANASILDWLDGPGRRHEEGSRRAATGEAGRLPRRRPRDRAADPERRGAQHAAATQRDLPEAPIGVPDSFHEHVHLMFDLIAAAFQSDLTRVFSFKLGRDASGRVYPGAEAASRHGRLPPDLAPSGEAGPAGDLQGDQLLPREHGAVSARQAEGHAGGRQNLLEKSLIIYGSPMGDSNLHNHVKLPLFLLGHANGALKGNTTTWRPSTRRWPTSG